MTNYGPKQKPSSGEANPLADIGGEPLEGSDFEEETPEPEFINSKDDQKSFENGLVDWSRPN